MNNQVDQVDQITVLKNIIKSNNDQNKILQAEIKKWLDQSYACWYTIE